MRRSPPVWGAAPRRSGDLDVEGITGKAGKMTGKQRKRAKQKEKRASFRRCMQSVTVDVEKHLQEKVDVCRAQEDQAHQLLAQHMADLASLVEEHKATRRAIEEQELSECSARVTLSQQKLSQHFVDMANDACEHSALAKSIGEQEALVELMKQEYLQTIGGPWPHSPRESDCAKSS